MAPKNYDFCGWVTKNDLRCSDGRTIHRDSFAHQDGAKVPLVWNHNHDSVSEVLGYTILENRPEGVYGYSYCNDTEKGQTAKMLVSHGDIDSYSIFANHLKQVGSTVHHGDIKEVSLVFSPANPGAYIENVALAHGEDASEDAAMIYTGELLEMYHSDEEHVEEIITHAEKEETNSEATVGDVLATLNEDQKKAVAYLLGAVASNTGDEEPEEEDVEHSDIEEDEYEDDYEDELEHSDYEGEDDMKTNVFDSAMDSGAVLSHSDIQHIISEAKSGRRTLKEAFNDAMSELAHADGDSGIEYSTNVQDYGVNDPSFLFPEAKALNNPPDWIKRPTDWVPVVMNGTKHTPFSRIKSVFANITADEARAKGYIKGNRKTEEVFTLLKRTTTPQTIYKKQKLDRDDIIDITDFNVVSWIRGEMRIMLDEEIARAILVGDGRLASSDDHISEEHIRPIWKDDALFTIRKTVTTNVDQTIMAKDFIKAAIRARKDYKGSGNPVLFTTEDWLTEMLLLEDGIGHPLYKTEAELATKMRVSRIVTVPVMENLTYNSKALLGIIVNLSDYNVGADKGGEINMFDDFDIDFNQYKYLIETRCSGALIKPYSAIVIEASASNTPAPEPDDSNDDAQG